MVWLILLMLAWACEGRTLRVPSEYITIQSALDSVQNSDTVLVALGTYAEALNAPSRSFVLWGDVPSDTGNIPRPTVDPSPLPGSDTLTCLFIPTGAHPTIQNFRFRNGPQMFPRFRIGGIWCLALSLTVRDCFFDSTYTGIGTDISSERRLNLSDCIFRHNFQSCVRGGAGRLCATRCAFDGVNGLEMVMGADSSSMTDCVFSGDTPTSLLWLTGNGLVIDRNVFSSAGQLVTAVVADALPDSQCSGEITNNQFANLNVNQGALWLAPGCNESARGLIVRDNEFINNTRGYNELISVGYADGSNGASGVTLQGNLIEGAPGGSGGPEVLSLSAAVLVQRNTFQGMRSQTLPAIQTTNSRTVLRENNFIDTHVALCKYLPGGDSLDARNNWWGDASGPYDPVLNPLGRGAEIICNHEVRIFPWLDSAYVPSEAHSPFILHPSAIILSVSPNPFNPVTRIRYDIPKVGIVTLKVFDVLGREVATLVDERMNPGSYTIEWSAKDLPSGMYFAVLRSGDHHAVQKMLLMK